LKTIIPFIIVLTFFTSSIIAQSAVVKGIIKDENGKPIEGVAVTYNQKGSSSNNKGEYSIQVQSGQLITITFSHVSFNTLTKRVRIPKNRTLNFSPKLLSRTEEIDEVIVKNNKEIAQGIDKIPLALDTVKPKIIPINFKDDQLLTKYRFLKFRVSDDLSGIKSYRGEIDGKWILLEYDAKIGLLTYDFNDGQLEGTKHSLKVIASDNVNNTNTYIATFYKKE